MEWQGVRERADEGQVVRGEEGGRADPPEMMRVWWSERVMMERVWILMCLAVVWVSTSMVRVSLV